MPGVPTLPYPTTELFGAPLPGRMKAVQTIQGQVGNVSWQFLDPDTKLPVDLTVYGFVQPPGTSPSAITIRVVDSFMTLNGTGLTPVFQTAGTVTDPLLGFFSFTLPDGLTANPGIYLAEAAAFNDAGQMVLGNQFYVIVNAGLNGLQLPPTRPPSIAEIRLHMRDSDPGENLLLDTLSWDLAEIALCIERPVLYWNEAQPPIDAKYTTLNFPYRYWWLQGVVSQLYLMAAHFYRKNYLPASAGGVQVDDMNKSREYEEMGRSLWQDYRNWSQTKKIQLNAEGAVQISPSPYSGYFNGSYYGSY
jgi:hypothetical protein